MAKTFDYTAEDLLNPEGNNNLGTLGGFYQRSLYKEAVYPSTFVPALDTCHDKLMYGRVDRAQNTVSPASKNLIPIPSGTTPNVLALNVVVKAFEEFVLHMKKAAWMGVVNKTGNSDLFDIKAHRAFEPPSVKYSYFTQRVLDSFVTHLSRKQKEGIQDFQSFLKYYRRHLLDVASITPITVTNYQLTRNASLFSTGLSIAIAQEDASKDADKYESFVNDPNFEFFRRCARKFGFVVDKNAPWILTADLFTTAFTSTGMAGYTAPNGGPITKDNFFQIFYDPMHLGDFGNLIRILVNSYRDLLKKAPFYDAEVGVINDRCSVAAKERKKLGYTASQVIVADTPSDFLTDKFLVDLYIDLRQAEVGSPLSPRRLRTLKQEAYEVYAAYSGARIVALQRVADYVNNLYREYIYDVGAVALQIINARQPISLPAVEDTTEIL